MGNWSHNAKKVGATTTNEERLDTSFNEYYEVGGATQSHDANGNQTYDGVRGQTYEWDTFDRLVRVKNSSNQEIGHYLYDTFARRVQVDRFHEGGGTSETLCTSYSSWRAVEERELFSADSREFVYGIYIDEPLLVDNTPSGQNTARYYYHQNALYSVYGLTDENGALAAAYEYDPYGKHVLLTDGDSDGKVEFDSSDSRSVSGFLAFNPYAFTGRNFDPESGLYNVRWRYYDSWLARWMSDDPFGLLDTPNAYAYVRHNPMRFLDPLGLMTREECAAFLLKIIRKATDLRGYMERYDPVEDGKGGHYSKRSGKNTVPGGHFKGINERRMGIKNDIKRYKKECLDCNDDDGPKGEPVPAWIPPLLSQPLEMPKTPAHPLAYIPGSDDLWETVGVGGLAVAAVAADVGLVAATGGLGWVAEGGHGVRVLASPSFWRKCNHERNGIQRCSRKGASAVAPKTGFLLRRSQ